MPDPQDKPAMRAWRARRRRQRKIRLWLLVAGAVVLLALGITTASVTLEPGRAAIWSRSGKQCGTIDLSGHLLLDPANGQGVADCFMRAYATCQAAVMVAAYGEVDTSTGDTFVVEPGFSGCSLADIYSETGPNGHETYNTSTCAGMSAQPYGLHAYACGAQGDRLVLTGANNGSPVVGARCGLIAITTSNVALNPASASQAADCFARAFQSCQIATLLITQTIPPPGQGSGDSLLSTLLVERHGAGCEIIFLEEYTDRGLDIHYYPDTCASLARQPDGLHLSCAKRKQVVVPLGAASG